MSNPESRTSSPAGGGERCFIVFVLLLSSGAFLNLLPSESTGNRAVAGNAAMQGLWASLYVVVVILLIRYCKGFISRLASDPWTLTLLLLSFGSTIWSADPGLTLKRSIGLLGTYLTAVYLAMRYDLRTQLRLVAFALMPALVLSPPFTLLGIGECGTDFGGPPGWCGIYSHKNTLGAMMALAILVFLTMSRIEAQRKWLMWFLVMVSVGMLLLSNSKSALISVFGVMVVLMFSRLLRGSVRLAITSVTIGVASASCVLYWVMQDLGRFTAFLNRDATFSGRLELWVFSVVMALQKPWLGYGYGAFWLGRDGPSERIMHALGSWQAFYAHNGLLELWLDLGLISVVVFIGGFLICLVRAILLLRRSSEPESAWPLLFLAFIFFTNLVESSLLSPDNISWILYLQLAFFLSPASQRSGYNAFAHTQLRRRPLHVQTT